MDKSFMKRYLSRKFLICAACIAIVGVCGYQGTMESKDITAVLIVAMGAYSLANNADAKNKLSALVGAIKTDGGA